MHTVVQAVATGTMIPAGVVKTLATLVGLALFLTMFDCFFKAHDINSMCNKYTTEPTQCQVFLCYWTHTVRAGMEWRVPQDSNPHFFDLESKLLAN